MYKYQQLIIYGYSIPYSKYNSAVKGTQFYKQYRSLENTPSERNIVLLPDVNSNNYCIFGLVQFATERSDIIEPINPPQKIEKPPKKELDKIQDSAEQAPISLNQPKHYILTHSE